MVEAFVGLVGGGKSLNSVRRMCSYMARGGRVATNIRLTGFCRLSGEFCPSSPLLPFLRSLGWEYQSGQYTYISFDEMAISPAWFKRVPAGLNREQRTLLVIDEATDLFDNLDRDKARSDSLYRELFRFLRLSRHAHIDVLFICQDLSSINSRLRGLVAGIWRSTDMKNFRLAKVRIPFPFDVFMLQRFDRRGKDELTREWVRKDPRVFDLYESEAFGQSIGVKWDGRAIPSGKIKTQNKGYGMFVKLLCVLNTAALVFLVVRSFREPPAPPAPAEVSAPAALSALVTASEASEDEPEAATPDGPPPPSVFYGDFRYMVFRGQAACYFDDKFLVLGAPSAYGTVYKIAPRFAICRQGEKQVWLFPSYSSFNPEAPAEEDLPENKQTETLPAVSSQAEASPPLASAPL